MSSRFFYNLGIVGIFLTPVVLAAALWIYFAFYAPVDRGSEETLHFTVEKDWNTQRIAKELENKKLIRNWWSINYLSKERRSGGGPLRIMAGEYELSPAMSPYEILDKLTSGKLVEYQVRIPTCATVPQVARLIAESNIVAETEINDALRNQTLMAREGIPSTTPEGYFLEGTYSFAKPITAEKVLTKIIAESQKSIAKEQGSDWLSRATKLGLTPHQVLTLASLVEKETTVNEEKPKIASVIFNRLKIEMPLENKAALAYDLGKPEAALTAEDKESSSPYNTFGKRKGLPASPICGPGQASIKAALYPEATDYLFFVKGPAGAHEFAATQRQYDVLVNEVEIAAGSAASGTRRPTAADINSILAE